MSKKNGRSGGKYGGKHTTVIPAAGIICDVADKCDAVTRIAVSYIKGRLKSSGRKRLKMFDEGGALRLSIRDSTSHQDVYVYTNGSRQRAIEEIAKGARDNNIEVILPGR